MHRVRSMRQLAAAVLTAAIITVSLPFAGAGKAEGQVRPIYDRGAAGLGQMLKRLQTVGSALHTAAHPDDEDSGLLAYLARREQARTAYLSLNRGDGGQNVVGEELFEGLGIIRTEELLQARRLDGGDQFFTRTMDYGFSKTRAEAARIWGEQVVLGDMVRAIRMYKPLVVISRFTGTPADGHGQHQLAGYLTPLAFKAAGDPQQFPEHMQEGLEPWQPLKLYVSQSFSNNPENQPTLTLNTGEYAPLIGRSYFEIAMEGRSQHKSQEMGVLELRGMQQSGLRLIESKVGQPTAKETSVFDGIDTSITGIMQIAGDSYTPALPKLQKLEDTAAEALRSYDAFNPQKLVPILARGMKEADDAAGSTRNPRSKAMLAEKKSEFAAALQMAAGIVVDALSNIETIVPGDSADVSVRVFAPEGTDVKVTASELKVPAGWTSASQEEPAQPATNSFRPRREPSTAASFFKVTVPANAEPTEPYWLVSPRKNFTFDWSAADGSKNMPFAAPLVTAQVKMTVGGQEIEVSQPVEFRFADDIRGELRRDINVVPAITVGLESDLMIASATSGEQKRRLVMTVQNQSPRAAKGTARFSLPAGWTLSPASAAFDLPQSGDKTALTFDVTIPAGTKVGKYSLTAVAESAGKSFDQKVQEVAYPHIQTHRVFTKADITAHVL
ncbi:MAG: PIG-L family deacetylase, partial [Pyrinomonadaceae bacterium]|nr:PIG-L family deacetylase [Pyrinomonadaceae bacterium]